MFVSCCNVQGDSSRERSEISGYGLLAMDRVGTGRKLAMDRVGPGRSDRVGSGRGPDRVARAGGRGGVHAEGKSGYAAHAGSPVSRSKRGLEKEKEGYAAAAGSPLRKKSGDHATAGFPGGRGESSRTRDEFLEYAAAVRKRDRRGVMRDESGGSDRGSEAREKGDRRRGNPRDGYRDRDVSG